MVLCGKALSDQSQAAALLQRNRRELAVMQHTSGQ